MLDGAPALGKHPTASWSRLGCAPCRVLAGSVTCGHQKGVEVRCVLMSMCFMPGVRGRFINVFPGQNEPPGLIPRPAGHLCTQGKARPPAWSHRVLWMGLQGAIPREEEEVRTCSLGNSQETAVTPGGAPEGGAQERRPSNDASEALRPSVPSPVPSTLSIHSFICSFLSSGGMGAGVPCPCSHGA